jgi:biopolymer transport protein TolQ
MEANYWVDHVVRASLFAKGIYLILLGLSVGSWAIIFRKLVLFRRYRRENGEFLLLYRKNRRNYAPLYRQMKEHPPGQGSPLPAIFFRGCEEVESLATESVSRDRQGGKGESHFRLSLLHVENLEEILLAEMERIAGRLESGQNFLATTSSVAPLLGLLGTVWGILEAFRGIGLSGSATAASMAPGMSEALITTVVGLMVAIPANLGYNFLGQRIKHLSTEGDTFLTEFVTNLKRFASGER